MNLFTTITLFATVVMMVTSKPQFNIAFVLDSYDSVGANNLKIIIDAIKTKLSTVTLGPDDINAGLFLYDANKPIAIKLTADTSLFNKVTEEGFLGVDKTPTNVSNKVEGSIIDTIKTIFQSNSRPDAKNAIIAILFGKYADDPSKAQLLAKAQSISVIAISVGDGDIDYLWKIVGEENNQNIIGCPNLDLLTRRLNDAFDLLRVPPKETDQSTDNNAADNTEEKEKVEELKKEEEKEEEDDDHYNDDDWEVEEENDDDYYNDNEDDDDNDNYYNNEENDYKEEEKEEDDDDDNEEGEK